MKQKTIQNEFTLSGVGLHTGCKVNAYFKPAPENTGIQFVRVDLSHKPVIRAEVSNIFFEESIPRCTSLGRGEEIIRTVEHLMAVLSGLQITNLTIELDGGELPGLDGAGLEFLKAIQKAGMMEQAAEAQVFAVQEPLGVLRDGTSIFIFPNDEFKISYTLDYDHPLLRSQFFETTLDPKIFGKEIAPCRTFCLNREAQELLAKGFGKGANYKNTLVVGNDGVIDNKVRFPDEFARHKVLDLIGDLSLLGVPIRGHVFAVKSGHTLNLQLLKMIATHKECVERKTTISVVDVQGEEEIDIAGIMKILPHRYPFLLVDRVILLEKGKKGLGIKNVTMNDNFFQGHFPTKPIMPGVLMIEAMAQTAGVVVLTNEDHRGKVAFFMAVDKVKFRKVVVPGDQLVMEVEVIRDRSRTVQTRGVAKVGEEIAAEAEMIFSFTDTSYLTE